MLVKRAIYQLVADIVESRLAAGHRAELTRSTARRWGDRIGRSSTRCGATTRCASSRTSAIAAIFDVVSASYTGHRMSPRPAPPIPEFALQFELAEIPDLAVRYSYRSESRIVDEIGPVAKERGYYTHPEFIEVCAWKTSRSKSRVARNSEVDVVEATRLALSTASESLRIWIPMGLSGVQWATASVLLHLGHRDRYPILDYRALEALGVTGHVNYTIRFWNRYVTACRGLPLRLGWTCERSTAPCGSGRRSGPKPDELPSARRMPSPQRS